MSFKSEKGYLPKTPLNKAINTIITKQQYHLQ